MYQVYGGILLDIGVINKLHIQPEVLYVNADETNFLYVPVLVKYYVAPKFNLQGGSQANFVLDETFDEFNTFGLDLTFGAGFDITKSFFVEARYSFEVTNRVDQALAFGDILVDNITSRFNSLTVGIGYKF